MRSNEEVAALLLDLAESIDGIDYAVRKDESMAALWVRNPGGGARVARVSRSDFIWYQLTLDQRYFATSINEDLTVEEEADDLKRFVSLATQYIRTAVTEHRSRILRTPYVTVRLDGEEVDVYQLVGKLRLSTTPWEAVQSIAIARLFGPGASDVAYIDPNDPWGFAH